MRYFIDLAYNGKNYHGWQVQPDAISVQETLQSKMTILLREDIQVTGAGRTDTGVHASQMVAHFDMENEIEDLGEMVFRLNSFLPKDIAVADIYRVRDDAHARFDALEREYEYRITTRKDPFRFETAHQLYKLPDIGLMNEAAGVLLGLHDFQCFSRSNTDVKTYHCNVMSAVWEFQDDNTLVFTIRADRFLRNMVRAVVGTLLEIGFGKISVEDLKDIIESKDRSRAGASAPAHGLFLTEVKYSDDLKT